MARQRSKRQGGTGSIVHEKNGVAIRWPEYVLLPGGITKRKMRYEFLGEVSARQANDALLDRMAQARREGPKPIPQSPVTFKNHVERWQRDILESTGVGTEDLYKFSVRDVWSGIIGHRLNPRFGNLALPEISTSLVQTWITDLRKEGLAASTIRKYRQVLSVVLAKAVTWGEIAINPAKGLDLPKIRNKEQQKKKWALTPRQAGELLRKIGPLRPRAMVALAITTGLRRGELVALRWKSLDEGASEIVVMEASYRGHIDTPKTDAGDRKVPVNQWTLDLLSRWRRLSKHTRPDDFIFATRTGKQESPGNIMRRYVAPACRELELRRPSWNLFRRTFSTWLDRQRQAEAKIEPKTIKELMGHADEKTQRIYIQPDEEARRIAADKIGDDLSRYCPDESHMGLPWLN